MDYTTLSIPTDAGMVPVRYSDARWSLYRVLELESPARNQFCLAKKLVL